MPVCPDCGGSVSVRDSRRRTVIDLNGQPHIFQLRRLQCAVCGHIHLEIPDCIQPQKHYGREAIRATVSGECDCCAADNSTIYRWKHGK